jgi:uncharacterized protein YozE (UPF0346 family)
MKRSLIVREIDSLRRKLRDTDAVIEKLMNELEPEDVVFMFKPDHGTWGARNDFWTSVRDIFDADELDIDVVKTMFYEFMLKQGGVMDPVAELEEAIGNDEKVEKHITNFAHASRCVNLRTTSDVDTDVLLPSEWKLFVYAFAGTWPKISEKFTKVIEAYRERLGDHAKDLAQNADAIRKAQSGGK